MKCFVQVLLTHIITQRFLFPAKMRYWRNNLNTKYCLGFLLNWMKDSFVQALQLKFLLQRMQKRILTFLLRSMLHLHITQLSPSPVIYIRTFCLSCQILNLPYIAVNESLSCQAVIVTPPMTAFGVTQYLHKDKSHSTHMSWHRDKNNHNLHRGWTCASINAIWNYWSQPWLVIITLL